MSKLIKPEGYRPLLDKYETEQGIKLIKDFFQENLSTGLHLRRVTGPLFVQSGLGINDDLNGTERPVRFPVKDLNDAQAEVVHSLAKWKRLTLADFKVKPGYGIYTDMNAIRADEELDNIHSLYVDQWDWEQVITAEQRTLDYLKGVVKNIYYAMLRTEFLIRERFPQLGSVLAPKITFIHSDELCRMYPDMTPKERENAICRAHKSVFIIGIGGELSDGKPHDGRAPDYDDYSTPNAEGFKGLNGDLLVWNDVIGQGLELSSMGIRVDKEALLRQLHESGKEDRLELYFHKRLLNGDLPLSIGGGIGQSRLCMHYLQKAHIGEIQASIWPQAMREECSAANIPLI
ncbi:aspartate--ammonia ligase [Pseudoprevotella muciniphila]|uniref:Aspartate--ammonia ligase n=1 Tax=Pseudoprevotella muciniphila TaxID=2133944 RepID=A0A5P8E8Y4_9BACT|nr:aspartate--ammonia ligase [Pseudoprevotella muciniphila]QFQ13347.1 aspartate--ammonia ligase [Pseudoprevotella muciniphila]